MYNGKHLCIGPQKQTARAKNIERGLREKSLLKILKISTKLQACMKYNCLRIDFKLLSFVQFDSLLLDKQVHFCNYRCSRLNNQQLRKLSFTTLECLTFLK